MHCNTNVEAQSLAAARIPLVLPKGFSTRAVAAVMAEKFGLRGLRISAMIGLMAGYLWWRGCDNVICVVLYVFAAAVLILAILVTWTAKEMLDKFARDYAHGTWLTLDIEGIGGEAGEKSFKMPWQNFRRVNERHRMWLLETVNGNWMVLPTTEFSAEAWALMRANQRVPNPSLKR
jgi:hypothetical protein